MGRLAALGITGGLLWIAASVAVEAAPRGGFFSPGLAPRSPEIMLYFSHSIGGADAGGSMRPTFGLRVQQVRQAANTGDPDGGDSMQHRELVNWQMEAHSDLQISNMRVKLGNRVTYDVTNRRFGSPSGRSAMQIELPTLRNAPLNPSQQRPLFARSSAPSPATHDSGRDNSSMREIAVAAVAALSPARFTSAQRQTAQRQGFHGVIAAQRMQGARGGLGNSN